MSTRKEEVPLTVITIFTIFAVTMLILTRFETIGITQGQANHTIMTILKTSKKEQIVSSNNHITESNR